VRKFTENIVGEFVSGHCHFEDTTVDGSARKVCVV